MSVLKALASVLVPSCLFFTAGCLDTEGGQAPADESMGAPDEVTVESTAEATDALVCSGLNGFNGYRGFNGYGYGPGLGYGFNSYRGFNGYGYGSGLGYGFNGGYGGIGGARFGLGYGGGCW
jgi:hypothetical protein